MKSNAVRNVLKAIRVTRALGLKAAAEMVRRKVDTKYREERLLKRREIVKKSINRINNEKMESAKKRQKIVEGRLRQIVSNSSADRIMNQAIYFLSAKSSAERIKVVRKVYDIAEHGNLKTAPSGQSIGIETEDLRKIRDIFSELVRIERIKINLRKKMSK